MDAAQESVTTVFIVYLQGCHLLTHLITNVRWGDRMDRPWLLPTLSSVFSSLRKVTYLLLICYVSMFRCWCKFIIIIIIITSPPRVLIYFYTQPPPTKTLGLTKSVVRRLLFLLIKYTDANKLVSINDIYRVFKIEGEIMFSMGIWKPIFTSIKTCLFISCFTNLFKMSKAWLSILIWNYNFIQDRWQMLLPQSALRCLSRNWKFESLDLIQILYSLLTFRCVVLLAVYTCTQLWMGHRWYICPMSQVTRLKKTDNTDVH